jgi:hypothetical protein
VKHEHEQEHYKQEHWHLPSIISQSVHELKYDVYNNKK